MTVHDRHGWYVYDGKRVAGPYSVDILRQVQNSHPSPSSWLVTRKGFDQWYPIGRLEQWFHDARDRDLASEINALEQTVQQSAATLARLESPSETGSIQKVERPIIHKKAAPQVQKPREKPSSKNRNRIEAAPAQTAPRYQPKTQPPVILNIDQRQSPAHNYMLLKGRLRLGEMRRPASCAWIYMIMTCGLYAIAWYRSAYREIYWHALSQFKTPGMLMSILCVVPILGGIAAFRLAQLVSSMEQQNQYRATLPWLAAILGVFPPFAIYYLQCALNDHWGLHVKACR